METRDRKMEQIQKSLEERAERIRKAGQPGITPMAEECRRDAQREPQQINNHQKGGKAIVETYRTVQEAQNAGKQREGGRTFPGGKTESWRKTRISWTSITYQKKDFRETCIQFDQDQNLSRFVWRTAKLNGMKEITLSDVRKMLEAADETIWILRGNHEFQAEDPDKRAPTWVMQMDRKAQWVALMRITDAGWATTDLRDITIRGEQMKQRVWTLKG